jgi:hypothetical protein
MLKDGVKLRGVHFDKEKLYIRPEEKFTKILSNK